MFALVFLAGPQVRRESTAGLIRESYLKRKQLPVKRTSERTLISRHREAIQDNNRLDALILASAIIRQSRRPECHHPKCARSKEFSLAVRVAHLSVGDGPEAWGRTAVIGVLCGLSYFFWRPAGHARRAPDRTPPASKVVGVQGSATL